MFVKSALSVVSVLKLLVLRSKARYLTVTFGEHCLLLVQVFLARFCRMASFAAAFTFIRSLSEGDLEGNLTKVTLWFLLLT